MYHNFTSSNNSSRGLIISCIKFEEQIKYLVKNKYTFFFASELIDNECFPKRSVVVTFDDVTENQLIYALPILEKYNVKATFFIPFYYVGKSDLWNKKSNDYKDEKIMTIEQLKRINSSLVEFGHHSFYHSNFSQIALSEIQEDFEKSYSFIKENGLAVFQSIAYPYGKYPKKAIEKKAFFELLKKNNIKLGFRIGNRLNKFPLKEKYEIQRIDIKGEDSMFAFKLKIRLGKLLF